MPGKATQFVQLLRSTKREKRLGTVILFVTSRCNAFCQTCFYHEELNQPGDMTFAQIEKISRTMPPITDLWLSATLRPYGVASRTLWIGERSARGYSADDFEQVFKRYIMK